MSSKLRVAIIGGSIGGCTLALGLLQHPHIEFDIFERWTFQERGAAIGVAPNGQRALRALGLDELELLNNAGAFAEDLDEAIVAYGEHKGKHLLKLPGGIRAVLRIKLLDEFVRRLPSDRLHTNKKLVSIEEGRNLELKFADGSVHEADAIVGCDGLRSTVRALILGADHPNVAPVFSGYWDARAFMSTNDALRLFGPDIVQGEAREVFMTGQGSALLFCIGPPDGLSGVIATAKAEPGWDEESAKVKLTRELLEKTYGHYGEDYLEGAIDALLNPDYGPGILFNEFESQDAPMIHRGRLCIIGDAAHAALPWMGQGFSMTAEDAAVMSALLGRVQTPVDFESAFAAFESVRHGPQSRSRFLVENSRQVAQLCSGQLGLDPVEAKQHCNAEKLFAHLWQGNIDAEIRAALDIFERRGP